jgi:hypothetical protein
MKTDRYQHTQRSHLLLLLLSVAATVTLGSLALPVSRTIPLGPRLTIAAAALAMIASGLVFSSLTITTDAEHLSWHFGAGLFRKSVPLAEVVSGEPVRTTWVDGWGIHLTWRGWLYNVAGHNAVRVSLRSGKQFLLGTDEPAALAQALHSHSVN